MKQAFPLIRFSQGNLVFIAGKPVIKTGFPCLFPALPCMGLKNFQKYKLKHFHYSTKVFLLLSLQIMLLLCIPASCSQLALKWRQIALAAGAKNCKIWQQVVTVPSGVTTHSSCTHYTKRFFANQEIQTNKRKFYYCSFSKSIHTCDQWPSKVMSFYKLWSFKIYYSNCESNLKSKLIEFVISHKITYCQMVILVCIGDKFHTTKLSQLVAHPSIFRLFMKGKFDAYVLCNLWPKEFKIE